MSLTTAMWSGSIGGSPTAARSEASVIATYGSGEERSEQPAASRAYWRAWVKRELASYE